MTKSFSISQKSLANATVTVSPDPYIYDGTAAKPYVSVTDGDTTLVPGVDYAAEYSANTGVGTATATVSGQGNYCGTVTKEFTISPKSLYGATVTLGTTSYTYDGTEKMPSVTVKDGSKTLTENADYTVKYENNKDAGTAKVTVTGKGVYNDSVEKYFTIQRKSVSGFTVTLSRTAYTYDGTEKQPTVTVKNGSRTLVKGTDYSVSYVNNINAGTAELDIVKMNLQSAFDNKQLSTVRVRWL